MLACTCCSSFYQYTAIPLSSKKAALVLIFRNVSAICTVTIACSPTAFSFPHAVPMATYILGPSAEEHAQFYDGVGADGGELCANVTCLGQRGVYTTSSGLQVAYLSGLREERGKEDGGLVSFPSTAKITGQFRELQRDTSIDTIGFKLIH